MSKRVITSEDIEEYEKKYRSDKTLQFELNTIKKVIQASPNHNKCYEIARKIIVIDWTNDTNLKKANNEAPLFHIANHIKNIKNIDKRLKEGDPALVNEIAKIKKIGNENEYRNFFSFATKYCCYHNYLMHNKDDYYIFDRVVKEYLPNLLNSAGITWCNNRKFTPGHIDKLRKEFKYEEFKGAMDKLLEINNLNPDKYRRKLDHYIWYKYRELIKYR